MIEIKVGYKFNYNNNYIKNIRISFQDKTIMELIEHLELDKSLIGGVLINGVPKVMDEVIRDNDQIYILPIIQGG